MYGQSMWFDIDHARDELAWQPRYSNDEMLAESYDWFVANRAAARRPGHPHRPIAARPSSRLLSLLKRISPATIPS